MCLFSKKKRNIFNIKWIGVYYGLGCISVHHRFIKDDDEDLSRYLGNQHVVIICIFSDCKEKKNNNNINIVMCVKK